MLLLFRISFFLLFLFLLLYHSPSTQKVNVQYNNIYTYWHMHMITLNIIFSYKFNNHPRLVGHRLGIMHLFLDNFRQTLDCYIDILNKIFTKLSLNIGLLNIKFLQISCTNQ